MNKSSILQTALCRACCANQYILIVSPSSKEAADNFEALKLLAHKNNMGILSIDTHRKTLRFSTGSSIVCNGRLKDESLRATLAGCHYTTIIFDEEVSVFDSERVPCVDRDYSINKQFLLTRVR